MSRSRRKTMILVEGDHEKNYLLKLLLKVFSEIPVTLDNVYVYQTNIYELYNLIEKEYGVDWDEIDQEIDIALLYSKHLNIIPPLVGRDFNNIIMVFDYERQDTYYSEDKIKRLQNHFSQTGEDGVLFINYPMIEAYLDFEYIPDEAYLERKVPVTTVSKKGEYKRQVNVKSVIWKYLKFYDRTVTELEKLGLGNEEAEHVTDEILTLRSNDTLRLDIKTVLSDKGLSADDTERLSDNLYYAIIRLDYISNGCFYDELRRVFLYIAEQVIKKSYKIQTDHNPEGQLKSLYEELEFETILMKQNEASHDTQSGFIWVLATSMAFLGEYKFFWMRQLNN